MRNYAWNEMDRTYTKKSSEKHFWTKFADRNHQIVDRNYGICSLVRSDKKVQKLQTAIIGSESANLQFKAVFSLELRDFNALSSQTSLNWLENRSQARKKRKNTIREGYEEGELKNRTKNRIFSWCILLFTLFSCCVVI